MKTLIMIGALVLAGGCGKKKNSQEGMDPGTGSSAMGSSMGSAPAAGSGSAAPTMAGSGSAAPTMAGSDTGSGSAAAAAAAAAVDVPTEADFEADAKTKITDKNVDTELTSIEKDLAQ